MKESKEDKNRWKDISCVWIGIISIVKWLYYLRQSTDSVQSLWNYQWHFSQKWNKNFLKFVETQKTSHSQSNLEKGKQSWRNQPPWLQTILQSCSHENSMVLAQKWKYRSMEQDRKSRNKPMRIWLWQKRQDYIISERQSL